MTLLDKASTDKSMAEDGLTAAKDIESAVNIFLKRVSLKRKEEEEKVTKDV